MSKVIVSVVTARVDFSVGTVDTPWSFSISGTLEGGAAFSQVLENTSNVLTVELAPGTYSVVVSKNGVSSLASDPFVIAGAPAVVTLEVPDAAAKPAVAAA